MKKKQFKKYVWLDFEEPSQADIDYLNKHYQFHHLALEDCLSTLQRPKIDKFDDHLFLVFHLPKFLKSSHRTVSQEIDIFIGKDYIITLHGGNCKPIDQLFSEIDEGNKDLLTKNPSLLLYELLDKSFNFCFPMLDKISEKLEGIEDELYHDQSRSILEKIALAERDIINFRRIINPQRYILKDLELVKSSFLDKDTDLYFGDIADKIERIWDLLDNFKEVSEVLQHTNESILTQRLNEIIKILTIFSVIMLPLTVITGFYGMNIVGLPFAGHKLASEIVTAILILVVLGMLFYFSKRKWL